MPARSLLATRRNASQQSCQSGVRPASRRRPARSETNQRQASQESCQPGFSPVDHMLDLT